MITWILKKRLYQSPKTILHGRDAILRVRSKWLIFNMVSQLWANVKYHVPTGFGFLYYPDFGWPFWVLSLMGVDSVTNQRQTKGTVLLVCICQRHTKRTVPLVCGLRLRLESSTPHHQRRPPQRGRRHRQKDKNRSPSAKNQSKEIRLPESANKNRIIT